MKIGDKLTTKNGEIIEIITDEITTQDIAFNSNGDLFVDDNGNMGMETVVVRRVRLLNGPQKGKEFPMLNSELSSAQ